MPLPGFGAEPGRKTPLTVRCGPLGSYLRQLGVSRVDYTSLDVEGSELIVISSLLSSPISMGVLMIEVRGDGQRARIAGRMLAAGFDFVGQIYAKPSPANEVVNDVYVNRSHLGLHFPDSRALS